MQLLISFVAIALFSSLQPSLGFVISSKLYSVTSGVSISTSNIRFPFVIRSSENDSTDEGASLSADEITSSPVPPPSDETTLEGPALLEKRMQVLINARDPFVGIRLAAWTILGLASVVSMATAILSGELTNAGIGGGVAVAMAAALAVEKKIGDEGRKKIEEELANEMLKGGMDMFVAKREEV